MMKILLVKTGVLFFIALVSLSTHAEENMKFHGTLVTTPDCTINNNQPIEVKFGNVGVNKVDGINYSRDIDYHIICEAEDDSSELYLSLTGNAAEFDTSAVVTTADNLAIEIREDDKPFVLGTQIKVELETLPKLTAVPVKKDGESLVAGDFSAAATLLAFYQ